MTDWRIGQGIDVHAFGPGDHVVLGGVRIAHSHGILAHSDGDVVAHAVCDAILGALALGDIGQHFPDSDPAWSGADSLGLLEACVAKAVDAGWTIGNVDVTVIAELPKLAPHVAAMREGLAVPLRVAVEAVSVKATTSERLGFTGRGEGIAATAVVLLQRSS